VVFCCFERQSNTDIAERPAISRTQAAELIDLQLKLRRGEAISYQALDLYNSGRIFGHSDGHYTCSCWAFPPFRSCLHTLGHQLMSGSVAMPTKYDETRLSMAQKGPGRQPRGGGRYGKGVLIADNSSDEEQAQQSKVQVDALESSMKALPAPERALILRKRPASAAGIAYPLPAASTAPLADASTTVAPGRKRMRGKTSSAKPSGLQPAVSTSRNSSCGNLPAIGGRCIILANIEFRNPKGHLVKTLLAGTQGVVQECYQDVFTRIDARSENGQSRSYWVPREELVKVDFGRAPLGGQGSSSSGGGGTLSPQALQQKIFTSKVGQRLVEFFSFPPWVVTSLFAGLAQTFTELEVLGVFEEDWLRDLSDRWLEFGYQLQGHGIFDAENSEESLPLALPYLRLHLFGIVRCARHNSKLVGNTTASDEDRLKALRRTGFTQHASSGHNSNCLIDSLITALVACEFIAAPGDREKLCDDMRTFLCKDPALYPRNMQGRRDAGAYLEHHRQGPAIVRRLMCQHGAKTFPQSFQIVVHARWDTEQTALDTTVVMQRLLTDAVPMEVDLALLSNAAPPAEQLMVELHLFNFTAAGTTGYHYDALERVA
jgi:hypothetical protein